MPRRLSRFLCLPLALGFLILTFAALAAEGSREISIRVDPELQSAGIHAAGATPLARGAKGNPGPGPAVAAFVSFDQPFFGSLHLRGYTRDGAEIARSAAMTVNRKAEAGGHLTFSFDTPTSFANVSHLTLMGERLPGPAPRPAPRRESAGEEAKQIVRELLQ